MLVGNLHTDLFHVILLTEFYIRIYFVCNEYCLKKLIHSFFLFNFIITFILFLFSVYLFFMIIFTIVLVSFINIINIIDNVHYVTFELKSYMHQ